MPIRSNVSVWVAFILLVVGTIGAYQIVGLNQALLFLIGGALGMTLYHASFGFTSSWRVFIKERRGRGLRAQMIMLGLAVLLFFPALGAGELFGNPCQGQCQSCVDVGHDWCFYFWYWHAVGGGLCIGYAIHGRRWQCAYVGYAIFLLLRFADCHITFRLVV